MCDKGHFRSFGVRSHDRPRYYSDIKASLLSLPADQLLPPPAQAKLRVRGQLFFLAISNVSSRCGGCRRALHVGIMLDAQDHDNADDFDCAQGKEPVRGRTGGIDHEP